MLVVGITCEAETSSPAFPTPKPTEEKKQIVRADGLIRKVFLCRITLSKNRSPIARQASVEIAAEIGIKVHAAG